MVQTIATTYYDLAPQVELHIQQLDKHRSGIFRLQFADQCKILKFAQTQAQRAIWKEAMLMNLLHQYAFPVPVVEHHDLHGEMVGYPFLLMDSAGEYTVTNLIDNDNNLTERNISLFTQMGSILAQIHGVNFPQSGDIVPQGITPRSASLWQQQIYNQADLLVAKAILNHDEIQWFQSLKMPEIEGLSLCHGDFHGVQCIVKGDQITAVVDWESAWVGNPTIDFAIAHAYHDCYCPNELTACLVQGYRQVRSLPDDYLKTYLPVRMAHTLGMISVWHTQGFTPGKIRAIELFRDYCNAAM